MVTKPGSLGAPEPGLDPAQFTVRQAELTTGVRIAYVHEGVGGEPVLLVHGYPETKRIWWRNIEQLSAGGFEVIAPDLRGFGDSGLALNQHYDPAAYAEDLRALVRDILGHERISVVAGDLGMSVAIDLALRYEGLVTSMVLFNGPAPSLRDAYRDAGIPPDASRKHRPAADYFLRQGTEAVELLGELDTEERRRRYVASFYGHRLWGSPGAFDSASVNFHAMPFGDADHLATTWGSYQVACGTRPASAVPRLFEPVPVPTVILYGSLDPVVPPSFIEKCRVAFEDCVGPFVLPDVGHFVQWEAATTLNRTVTRFILGARSQTRTT